ncbi:ATP-dependent carboxylate-amine ligase [Candidatus Bathyarchaeota archaeon]|nr:MAG: ATP-dependent carboxylate-amine ligase [Candidatus Bathyarchaeota archaeon]
MILIVTNREDYTADYVILEFHRLGIPYFRFNTEDFPTKAALIWHDSAEEARELRFASGKVLDLSQVHSVWYRRPVSPTPSPELSKEANDFVEAEAKDALLGIWRTLDCFWVSHPDRIREAENKLNQLKRAKTLGFRTPHTLVTNNPTSACDFFGKYGGKMIAKPLRESHFSTCKGSSIIYTNVVTKNIMQSISSVKYSPVIFQDYIPKKVEIRVNVFGSEVYATEIHSQKAVKEKTRNDWRRGLALDVPHLPHMLPADIEDRCRTIVRNYGLKFAAIDMILTPSNSYVFLEMNPNGQWAWIEPLTKQPLRKALIDLLIKGEELYA